MKPARTSFEGQREATSFLEWLGRILGYFLAIFFGLISLIRRARVFHPDGVTYRAQIASITSFPHSFATQPLRKALRGEALVRFSGAWWRHRKSEFSGRREEPKEWLDLLGCAIRFTQRVDGSVKPRPQDQDLMFATLRSVWTLPFAPFATRPQDFLANHYYAVSPFEAPGFQRVKFRLRPMSFPARFGEAGFFAGRRALARNRVERLDFAVGARAARLWLEVQDQATRSREWTPVVEIKLLERVELDQEALRFGPFQSGRGIRPRGFIHAMRLASYEASQRMRPRRSRHGDPAEVAAEGTTPKPARADRGFGT